MSDDIQKHVKVYYAVFAALASDPEVKGVIVTGAGDKAFVAGADIRYFVNKIKSGRVPDIVEFTRKGHALLLKIENGSCQWE